MAGASPTSVAALRLSYCGLGLLPTSLEICYTYSNALLFFLIGHRHFLKRFTDINKLRFSSTSEIKCINHAENITCLYNAHFSLTSSVAFEVCLFLDDKSLHINRAYISVKIQPVVPKCLAQCSLHQTHVASLYKDADSLVLTPEILVQ